jgi:hypothetical protein
LLNFEQLETAEKTLMASVPIECHSCHAFDSILCDFTDCGVTDKQAVYNASVEYARARNNAIGGYGTAMVLEGLAAAAE